MQICDTSSKACVVLQTFHILQMPQFTFSVYNLINIALKSRLKKKYFANMKMCDTSGWRKPEK